MEFVLKLLIGIVLLVAGFLAVVGWQSFTRGTTIARLRAPGDADGPPGPRDPLFCETLSLLTKTAIVPGHQVEIFACGDETYPRLWEDLRNAQRSITLQMYYCQPGRMADEFKDILDRAFTERYGVAAFNVVNDPVSYTHLTLPTICSV